MRKRLAAVPVLVLALTGCSIGSPVPQSTPSCTSDEDCGSWLTFDSMVEQWDDTVATLEVPLGTSMREPELDDFGGGDQQFTSGYGRSIAHSQWFCLWEGELLNQPDPSSPEAAFAVEQLRRFLDTETFEEDYSGDVGTISMIDDAAEGERGRMQNDYELNCSDYQ
jgi:hypothetical protein